MPDCCETEPGHLAAVTFKCPFSPDQTPDWDVIIPGYRNRVSTK